ncbi:MAG: mechanosensitive ion channel family protein [Bdellovibrionales bacterium]|nr:mechanosensitive ion channel family protein [Bdellovibrionales bacterium]
MSSLEFLNAEYLGNPLWRYFLAIAVGFGTFLVLSFIRSKLIAVAKRRNSPFHLTVERIRISTLFLAAAYATLSMVDVHQKVEITLRIIFTGLIGVQVMLLLGDSASVLIAQSLMRGSKDNPSLRNAAKNLRVIIKFAIWTMGVLFMLSNLGFNVGSLLTGLGIGGIAIALAAQNLLGDAFGCFIIYLDHPFDVGDAVSFDNVAGKVEDIGLRTTRIRANTGEVIIVANSDLTKTRITKPSEFNSRRITLRLGVVYGLPFKTIQSIPELIKSLAAQVPGVTCERAHFVEFGAYSLNFEVVLLINAPVMKDVLDLQQQLQFAILESFEQRGISFAFPTQTLEFVNKPSLSS